MQNQSIQTSLPNNLFLCILAAVTHTKTSWSVCLFGFFFKYPSLYHQKEKKVIGTIVLHIRIKLLAQLVILVYFLTLFFLILTEKIMWTKIFISCVSTIRYFCNVRINIKKTCVTDLLYKDEIRTQAKQS